MYLFQVDQRLIGLKGTFEVDPGRGEFLLCLRLDAYVAPFAKRWNFHRVSRKKNLFVVVVG